MRHMRPINRRRAMAGVTLIELIVVMFIVGLILPVLSTFLVSAYRNAFSLSDRVQASTKVSSALWYMDDQVRIAKDFVKTVPAPFTDAYGPHNLGVAGQEAWSYKGDGATQRVLITRNYATTVNPLGTGRQPVFTNTPEFNCSTQMYYQPMLTYISIYFVKDSTLYRRVLNDRTTTLCAGNSQAQLQSCPPYITSGRDGSCQANDEVLANDVYEFSVDYYQLVGDGTSIAVDPTYTSSDPDVLAVADYVMVNLTISTNNGKTKNTASQRMTKVNK